MNMNLDRIAFYKSALAAAAFLDSESPDQHLLDEEGDSAWRNYGDDLPLVIRIDTVLRNLAILYPAAFAPGPVFDLPGWYDDDPWGVGVEDRVADPVPMGCKLAGNCHRDVVTTDREHARHVLHQHDTRLPQLHRIQKTAVELVARVSRESLFRQIVELGAPHPREPLAGWSTHQDIWCLTSWKKACQFQLLEVGNFT